MTQAPRLRPPKKPKGATPHAFRDFRTIADAWADYCGERRLWITLDMNARMPEWPCCYALYIDGELMYIGQTGNLLDRFRQHFSKGRLRGMDRSRITIKAKLARRFGSWAMDELRLLAKIRPPWNRSFIHKRNPFS